MSQTEHYEVLILGSGAGGKLLAWQMARSGATDCGRGAPVDRGFLSQYQLPAQQE